MINKCIFVTKTLTRCFFFGISVHACRQTTFFQKLENSVSFINSDTDPRLFLVRPGCERRSVFVTKCIHFNLIRFFKPSRTFISFELLKSVADLFFLLFFHISSILKAYELHLFRIFWEKREWITSSRRTRKLQSQAELLKQKRWA